MAGQLFAVLIFAVLVYLLSKIIIEKNAQSISMAKILGYSKGEIARLYVMPTSIVIVLCVLINIPLNVRIIGIIWKAMLSQMMTGYLPYWIDPRIYVEMFVAGVICYGVVAALELKRIGKSPDGYGIEKCGVRRGKIMFDFQDKKESV